MANICEDCIISSDDVSLSLPALFTLAVGFWELWLLKRAFSS